MTSTATPTFHHTRTHFVPKPNKFAGSCGTCRQMVPEGHGTVSNISGKWVVFHVAGECNKAPAPVAAAPVEPTTAPVPKGTYTVVFADGSYRTLRVRVQGSDATFMPGVALVSYLSGSNNDSDYTSFGNFTASGSVNIWRKHRENVSLAEAVKVLLGDPKAAAQAYSVASGCCYRCSRTLTTPESVAAGVGPECASKASF